MEYGDVVEHTKCSRCNAPAVIRSRLIPESLMGSLELHLTCPKCRVVIMVGLTTVEAVRLRRILDGLSESYDKAKTERERQKIESSMKRLQERVALHELTTTNRFAVRVIPTKGEE